MKVQKTDLNAMTEAIKPLDTPERRERYILGNFPRADRVKDLNKRYRWDLWWDTDESRTLFLGQGIHDAHIDTALRRIVPVLEAKPIELPTGSNASAIRHFVGSHHVGESTLSVIRDIWRTITPATRKAMPKRLRRGVFRFIADVHAGNRQVYTSVMSGNLG